MIGFLASVIAVLTDAAVRRRYRKMPRDPLFVASVVLVVSAIPSVLLSENISRALSDYRSYWELLIYFLVAYHLTSAQVRRWTFWILLVSMSVSSLVALTQYLGGVDLFVLKIASKSYRPSSTLYSMTFAGILYQLISTNAAVVLAYRRTSKQAIAIGVGLVLQITAIFLTLTRGAWLALIGGLFSVPLLLKRRVLFLVVLGLALLGGTVALQNPAIHDRAATLLGNLRGPTDDNVSTRLVLWDISWDVFKAHPVFGVGMGDYSIEATKHLDDRTVLTTVDSHNIYLQMLATRGLVGFIPFVGFWVVWIRGLFQSRRRAQQSGNNYGYHFITGVIAATIAVLIGALTENNIDDSEVHMCFMLLIGMARSFDNAPPDTSDPL